MYPSDVSWWRANAASILSARFAGTDGKAPLSEADREKLRAKLTELQQTPDDAKLIEMLRRYAPDDPARTRYPG